MDKKLVLIVVSILAVIALIIVIKDRSVHHTSSDKLQVSTSFYPLYFFASQIGGDKAEVYNITPAGAEPHDYELTPQDSVYIERSKLIILNGGKLEPWGDKIKENVQDKSTVISVGEDLITQQLQEEGRIVQDPHVWLSPLLAKKEVEIILQGFIMVDPSNEDYYKVQARALQEKLDDLNEHFKKGLSMCQRKDVITSHAAFGYLLKEYNLNQVAIAGLSPDEEPSAQKLIDITQFVKKNNIQFIFFETLVNPKLARTLAEETGVQTLVLNPLEGLTDEEISQGKDYFTEMKKNLVNLRIALACQ